MIQKVSVLGSCLIWLTGCATHTNATETPSPEAMMTDTPEEVSPTPAATPTSVPEAGEGALALRFKLQEDWYDYLMERGEVPAGPFWGSIYGGTVGDTGPGADSVYLGDVYVEQVVFLPNDGQTEVLFTTTQMPTGTVYILGFVDTDGNADSYDPTPESKDPVTVPSGNAFVVKANQTTDAVVYFDMLFPSGS